MRTDGRTERLTDITKVIFDLPSFVNTPKKYVPVSVCNVNIVMSMYS